MKLRKQKHRLDIKVRSNFENEQKQRHGPLFPPCLRAAICGRSGVGKTSLLIALLEHPNGIKFKNIYVHSNSLFQPKYQHLRKIVDSIPGMGFFGSQSEITPFEEVENDSVIIFDDLTSRCQNDIQKYFSMGRHKYLDCFYLCQTYSFIAKQLLRDNLNFIILFQMDNLNLKHVYSDHVSSCDVSFQEFLEMCQECWKHPFGFFIICKDSPLENGRFRCGFDNFFYK